MIKPSYRGADRLFTTTRPTTMTSITGPKRSLRSNTTIPSEGPSAQKLFIQKNPDACICSRGLPLPTVVIQSGWPEFWPWLNDEKDLWLVGGASVGLVLLIQWEEISGNKVKGELHVYGKDPAGNVVLLQSEVS